MNNHPNERRAYWAAQMDEAFHFMEAIRQYPLAECGENLASLVEAAEGLEVVFSQTLINRKFPRVFFIRIGLIESFRQVAREMNRCGWILKVEEGYRSPEMQRAQSNNPRHFDRILEKTIWELGGKVPAPELMLRRMSALIATRCRVGTHVSGSAIDISVLDRTTGEELRRGGPYVEISERTPFASPFITPEERRNRERIDAVMSRHGWVAYPYEFWHYSAGDAYAGRLHGTNCAARYGPVRFADGNITPIPDPESDELLEPLEFYRQGIEAALERRASSGGNG